MQDHPRGTVVKGQPRRCVSVLLRAGPYVATAHFVRSTRGTVVLGNVLAAMELPEAVDAQIHGVAAKYLARNLGGLTRALLGGNETDAE